MGEKFEILTNLKKNPTWQLALDPLPCLPPPLLDCHHQPCWNIQIIVMGKLDCFEIKSRTGSYSEYLFSYFSEFVCRVCCLSFILKFERLANICFRFAPPDFNIHDFVKHQSYTNLLRYVQFSFLMKNLILQVRFLFILCFWWHFLLKSTWYILYFSLIW